MIRFLKSFFFIGVIPSTILFYQNCSEMLGSKSLSLKGPQITAADYMLLADELSGDNNDDQIFLDLHGNPLDRPTIEGTAIVNDRDHSKTVGDVKGDFKEHKDHVVRVVQKVCYEVTCTSVAGRTQTLEGVGLVNGIVVAKAPTGMSSWVVSTDSGKVIDSKNCWSDTAVDRLGRPDIIGDSACLANARLANTRVPFNTFSRGAANPLFCSSIKTCGSSSLVVGQKFKIKATSLAGRSQVLVGHADSASTIVAKAPSGMGAWVFRVSDGKIQEAINCWSDRAVAEVGNPMIKNSELCQNHGPEAGVSSPYNSYRLGQGNPFARSEIFLTGVRYQ